MAFIKLTKGALHWWDSVQSRAQKGTHTPINTWDELVQAIRKKIITQKYKEKMLHTWQFYKQKPGQTVSHYTEALHQFILKAKCTIVRRRLTSNTLGDFVHISSKRIKCLQKWYPWTV